MNSGEFTEAEVIMPETKESPILEVVQSLRKAVSVDELNAMFKALSHEAQAHPEVIEAAKFRKAELNLNTNAQW